jgi:hypothetical protein
MTQKAVDKVLERPYTKRSTLVKFRRKHQQGGDYS